MGNDTKINQAGLRIKKRHTTAKEAKEYFADMERHRILFRYAGPEDDAAITLVTKLIKKSLQTEGWGMH